MKLKTWKKLSEKVISKNNHWSYHLDEFEIEGITRSEYHYVHSPGSTMVIPQTKNGNLLLVNQFRYLNQKESLEFPCGSVEDGLTSTENALKELREESGMSGNLEFIGEFSPYTGVSDEICSVYIATNLIHSPLQSDLTEEFELVEISINKFEKLIEQNIIWDGLTLSAWALAKKTFHSLILLFTSLILLFGCGEKQILNQPSRVLTGADLLLSENFELIKNKKIGIVTNHTAVLSNGVHLVDTLFARNDVEIIKLFGPEHGIRGDAPDGHTITDGTDTKTGIQVISLYGKLRKPTPEMLSEIEVLIFDIQDVGARFYTFISTMYYAIQAAAENNFPIVILDRPNPINGKTVAGPMLDTNFKSFVGITKLPIQHGMTVGELAQFFNRTEILETEKSAELIIVKMQNWKREFYYDDCNLMWIKPSPNMPDLKTAIAYPGLCLIEGTNISEGRGTYSPFLIIGSPFIDSQDVISEMKNYNLDGVTISDTSFTPISIPNMSTSPKYLDENCNGISINITDRNLFKPIDFTVNLIYTFHKLYPQKFTFRESSIDRLWGSDNFRKDILADKTPKEIIESYQNDLENFKQVRKDFLLY